MSCCGGCWGEARDLTVDSGKGLSTVQLPLLTEHLASSGNQFCELFYSTQGVLVA